MSDFQKPKRDAQTERLLQQFTNTDGPKGATQNFKDGWERIFGKRKPETDTETVVIDGKEYSLRPLTEEEKVAALTEISAPDGGEA